MTQTTPSHSQAVEAAVQKIVSDVRLMLSMWHTTTQARREAEIEGLESSLRAAITSQQEVAAPVGEFDDWPDFNEQAMGCGLEDRNITDRYEAMRYGWDEAMERVGERFEQFLAASRVPVASLASREQGVEAVGAVPVTDAMVETYLTANDDYWTRTDADVPTDPRRWRQGTPKEATRESLSAVFAHLASQPKAPAPVPVAQGEAIPVPGELVIKALRAMDAEARKRGEMFPQTADEQEEDTKAVRNVIASLEFYTTGNQCRNGRPSVKNWPNLPATPANMAVGAVGGVGAIPVRQIKQNPLWSSLWMDASQDEYDRATGEKRIVYLTPAPEQATTGSGQGDSELLDYLQRRGATVSIVQGDGNGFEFLIGGLYASTNPDIRKAIRAAILSTASPAGEVKS